MSAIPLLPQQIRQDDSDETTSHVANTPLPSGLESPNLELNLGDEPEVDLPNRVVEPLLTPPYSQANSEKKDVASLAYVVQLGALKNAEKVNEIVAKLKLTGYSVFTLPAKPVQGQVTLIYVGPDKSKEKMQSMLGKLKQLSNLEGMVKPYKITPQQ